MEDVITEIPPPSRFFQEDLNNFAPPPEPLPSPFLSLSNPKPDAPLRPSLLIVAISSPSLHIFHNVPSKNLIGSLIMPEIPFSGNTLEPSLKDKSCNIYSLSGTNDISVILVSVQVSVTPERSNLLSRLLIGDWIFPERVLILDSVKSLNFRGKLSPDETYAYKLETSAEAKGGDSGSLIKLEYFPSGSVIDGLGAALLSRCQLKKIKATLCVSWPEYGASVAALIRTLIKNAVPSLDLSSVDDLDENFWKTGQIKSNLFDSELYT